MVYYIILWYMIVHNGGNPSAFCGAELRLHIYVMIRYYIII